MSRESAARTLAPLIADLGGRFMLDPVGFTRADEMNLEPGIAVYLVGRLGVLGRVHADVVSASAVFISPDYVAAEWDKALESADPVEAAKVYSSIAVEYGRAHLADAPNLERWCELASKVVEGTSFIGMPLFAGWRSMPLPEDFPGRTNLLAHVLRELRFSLHGNAVIAAGIDPLTCMACVPGNAGLMALFGWREPYPEPTDADKELRRAAEETTNMLSARTLDALSDDEVDEFVALTEAIVAAAV